tara:strand:+ start:396 stop:875 length:480 start_codon:yes stop_codon:yes gene_type:complete
MKDNMSLKWQEIVVSFFYLGHSPFAPGTVGALGAMIILILLEIEDIIHLSIMIGLCYLGGLKAAPWCEKEFGKDPSIFVIDEVVGYWVAVIIFWIGEGGPSINSLIVLFVLFRFFDIVKFGPVKKMEEIEGGHGILLDDVVAGVFAGVVALIIFSTGLI